MYAVKLIYFLVLRIGFSPAVWEGSRVGGRRRVRPALPVQRPVAGRAGHLAAASQPLDRDAALPRHVAGLLPDAAGRRLSAVARIGPGGLVARA